MSSSRSDAVTESAPAAPVYVFISYASEDRPAAKLLHERLMAEPLLADSNGAVWMDRPEIEGGDRWKKEIDQALHRSRVVLALLTARSVDPKRQWIRYEHTEARRLFRRVVPILLEDCAIPEHLKDLQYVDFRADFEQGFRDLRNAIAKFAPRVGPRSARRFVDATPPLDRAFIGRQDELEAVFALIDGESKAVETGRQAIAIQGMGGTGKTMLVNELARRIAIHYPGGVATESRGQNPASAEAVLQKWAKYMLGSYPQPRWTVVDVRSNLREKYGEILVILDDVPAEDVGHVQQLLEALPPDATRLLTTRLADVGAALGCLVVPLKAFDDSDALEFLRNRLARKGPKPKDAVLRSLIESLGGHPLALELVAANCESTLDLAEDVEDLRKRLAEGEIEDIALDIPELRKHTSLAICLQDSVESLVREEAEGEKYLKRFAALGVFPDGALQNRDLISAVWGADDRRDARRTLRALVNRALVNRDSSSEFYFNHPILRAYAYGHLKRDPEWLEAVQSRYARYVIDVARTGFQGPPEEWIRLEPYRPHIHRIAQGLKESAEKALGDLSRLAMPEAPGDLEKRHDLPAAIDLAVDLASAVKKYVVARPEIGEIGRDCLHLGLACARVRGESLEEAVFLDALGEWHQKRDPDLAMKYFEAASAAARNAGDLSLEAAILTHRGELLRATSKPREALEVLSTALGIHRQLGNDDLAAHTIKSMGETHWRLGDHRKALELHLEALQIFVRRRNLGGEGDMLNKIGSVRFNEGNHREAIAYFEKALDIHRRVGNRSMEAEDLNDMAIAYRYLNDVWRSLPPLIDALEIHQATGGRRLQAITMCNMANVYLNLGFLRSARNLAEDALRIAEEVKDLVVQSWALSWKGQALQAEGDLEPARALFEDALVRARREGSPRSEAGHLGSLALWNELYGDPGKAHDLYQEAISVMERHELSQAFGGKRIEDFRARVEALALQSRE
jgi:tetratricopeptide (TPR) repeat protein